MEDPQPQENVSGAPEYLNILVANAPLAMAMFDSEMRYLVANGLWIEEFHLEEIPIEGASHYEIFPDLHESWKEVYDRCLEGHVERCEEDIFQRPDGSRDWVRWEVRPWRHQEGEIGGLIISCEVVTERKRAEQRTQFEKDFTEGLLAGASPVVVVDLDGRIGRSSEGARELSVQKQITDGETYFWDAFSDEKDRGEVEQSFRSEIARSDENGTFSFPNSTVTIFTDGDGKRRKIAWTNTAQKNDLGEVDRIIQIGFATEMEMDVEEEGAIVPEEKAIESEVEEAGPEVEEVKEETEQEEIEPMVSGFVSAEEADSEEEENAEEEEVEEPAGAMSDTGASLRELAEKVRAARGAASVRKPVKEVESDPEDEEGFDFLVGQPFAPEESGDAQAGEESPSTDTAAEAGGVETGEGADEGGQHPESDFEEEGEQAAESDFGGENEKAAESDVEEESDQGDESEMEANESELGEEESASELVAEGIEELESVGTVKEEDPEPEETENRDEVDDEESEVADAASEEMEIEGEAEEEASEEEVSEEAGVVDPVANLAVPNLEASGAEAKVLISQLVGLIAKLEGEVARKVATPPAVPAPPMVSAMPPPPLPGTTVARSGKIFADDPQDEEPPLVGGSMAGDGGGKSESNTPPEAAGGRFEKEEEEEQGPSAHEQAAEFLPFGLLLLDEELDVVYANPRLEEILGFGIDEEGVEAWIRRGCPDEQYAEEVLTEWRNAVWRRQLTKTFTLSNDEAALREVEFRPNLLEDGRLLLTVLDVTDSRRSEEALRSSEAKFRALFQDSGVGIALVDQTGDIFDVNPAMEVLLDAKRADLRLQEFADHVFPEDQDLVHGAVAEIMEGSKRAAEITARLRAAGVDEEAEAVWTRMNIVVVKDPDGHPMFTAYFAHDITSQRKATAELEESQEQNRALLEATPDLLFLIDTQGIIEDYICSLEFPITVGEEVVGADLRMVVPQLRNTLDGQLEEVAISDTVVKSHFSAGGHRFETRLVRSGESNRVLVLRDQTDAFANRELPPINPGAFEGMGDAVVTVTKGGVVTNWNSKAEVLFGVSRHEALGEQVTRFYGAESHDEYWESVQGVVAEEGSWSVDRLAFSRRDGTTGECALEMRALELDEAGNPLSMIAVHRDLNVEEKEVEVQPSGMLSPEAVYQKITNNLQIIYSLLNLQVNTLDDADARATLMSSQNRVRAISFVHQQLRDHDGMQQVDFAGFVEMLSEHLREIYEAPPEQVGVRIGFSDVFLPLEPSIPLALVLNELMSNAFWHGFGDGSKGEVGVDLKVDGREGTLVIRDSGGGMPEGDFDELKGLGLHIATTLAKQVGGTLEPAAGPDTAFEVRFKI